MRQAEHQRRQRAAERRAVATGCMPPERHRLQRAVGVVPKADEVGRVREERRSALASSVDATVHLPSCAASSDAR